MRRYLFKEVDNYGFNKIVREYLNYPSIFPLPFNMHHGWYVSERPRSSDLENNSSIILVFNKRQADIWRKYSDKKVAILGAPFIHYRRKYGILRSQNPKGMIVYPAHSGSNSDAVFNQRELCEDILKYSKQYNPITVSVHHDDILRGKDKIYREYGFNVFCSGHRKSIEFAKNFYNEIRKYKIACSNNFGSQLLYAVEMGIPYFVFGPKVELVKDETKGPVHSRKTDWENSFLNYIGRLFSKPLDSVTEDQQRFVLKESGVDDAMDPSQLRSLLIKALFQNEIPNKFIRLTRKIIYFME